MFRYCETKQDWRKVVFVAPFSYPWIFSKPEIEEPLKDSLRKTSALRDNKFPTAISWHPPLLSIKFSLTESFWNTAQNGSPTKSFCTARQKKSDRISWHNPRNWRNIKGFQYETFRHYDATNFPRKTFETLPPSYPYTFSLAEVSWNTAQKASPTKTFSALRDKKSRKNIVT